MQITKLSKRERERERVCVRQRERKKGVKRVGEWERERERVCVVHFFAANLDCLRVRVFFLGRRRRRLTLRTKKWVGVIWTWRFFK